MFLFLNQFYFESILNFLEEIFNFEEFILKIFFFLLLFFFHFFYKSFVLSNIFFLFLSGQVLTFKLILLFGSAWQESTEERVSPSRPELSEKELEELRSRRLFEQASNPYYIKPSSKDSRRTSSNIFSSPETPRGPPGDEGVNGAIPGLASSDKYVREQWRKSKTSAKKEKKGKSRREKESDDETTGGVTTHVVNRDLGEMPEGVTFSDDAGASDVDDPYKALNIDVQSPLRADERLPVSMHRQVQDQKTGPQVLFMLCIAVNLFPLRKLFFSRKIKTNRGSQGKSKEKVKKLIKWKQSMKGDERWWKKRQMIFKRQWL